MYTISKETDSIVLICHDCSHTERIDSFNESFGSRSTQAARAMQNHSREKHGIGYRIGAEAHSEELTGSWSSVDKRDGADSPTAVVTIHDESTDDYFVWARPSLFSLWESCRVSTFEQTLNTSRSNLIRLERRKQTNATLPPPSTVCF